MVRSIWNGGSMKPTSLVAVLVFLIACFLGSIRAQTRDKKDEVPIERCDRLPVVTMKVLSCVRQVMSPCASAACGTFLSACQRTLWRVERFFPPPVMGLSRVGDSGALRPR
jgi:hypothetical protein